MAITLKINEQFKDRKVCHNKVSKTVGAHTQIELRQLAIEARKSENRLLVECFEDLPSLAELLADKTAVELQSAKSPEKQVAVKSETKQ